MGIAFDEEWEEVHKNMEWGAYPSETVIRFVARNYYKKKRDEVKILDFGCGAGAHTWYLAREGFDTYAFDGSRSAIMRLEKRLERDKLSAHAYVMDGIDIDFKENFFDAVIDSACIYSNLKVHIAEMYQKVFNCLKVDGKFFTSCFGKDTDGFGTGDEIEVGTYRNLTSGNLMGRGMTHFFDRAELEEMLKVSGFVDICIDEIRYTDRGSMVHQYIAIAKKGKIYEG